MSKLEKALNNRILTVVIGAFIHVIVQVEVWLCQDTRWDGVAVGSDGDGRVVVVIMVVMMVMIIMALW